MFDQGCCTLLGIPSHPRLRRQHALSAQCGRRPEKARADTRPLQDRCRTAAVHPSAAPLHVQYRTAAAHRHGTAAPVAVVVPPPPFMEMVAAVARPAATHRGGQLTGTGGRGAFGGRGVCLEAGQVMLSLLPIFTNSTECRGFGIIKY